MKVKNRRAQIFLLEGRVLAHEPVFALQLSRLCLAERGMRVPLRAVDFLLFRPQVTNRQP